MSFSVGLILVMSQQDEHKQVKKFDLKKNFPSYILKWHLSTMHSHSNGYDMTWFEENV